MVVGRVGDQVLTNEAGEETRWVGRAVAPLYLFELCRCALSASGFSFGHSQLCSFYSPCLDPLGICSSLPSPPSLSRSSLLLPIFVVWGDEQDTGFCTWVVDLACCGTSAQTVQLSLLWGLVIDQHCALPFTWS